MIEKEKEYKQTVAYFCSACGYHSELNGGFDTIQKDNKTILKCPGCKKIDPEITEEEWNVHI